MQKAGGVCSKRAGRRREARRRSPCVPGEHLGSAVGTKRHLGELQQGQDVAPNVFFKGGGSQALLGSQCTPSLAPAYTSALAGFKFL